MAKQSGRQKRKQERLRADPRRQSRLTRVEAKLATKPERSSKRTGKVSSAELQAKLTKPTVIPAMAEKNPHKERRPSKAELLQRDSYAVFIDFNGHTCIRVGAGRDLTYYIPMDSAGLDVHSAAHERFDARFKSWGYPLLLAARRYAESAQSFGYTEKARQHLEAILSGSTSTKEAIMAGKKAMKKASKAKRVVFDPKRMIAKGNTEGLKKARVAKMAGSVNKYADRTIKHLVKLEKSGLRSGRYARLAFVLKHKKTNDVLGKKVGGAVITGVDLSFMVQKKHIQLI